MRTPRLELRLPTEDELIALAKLAADGVHDPAEMPLTGWTDQPSPQLERGVLHWHWGKRAQWTPTNWSFDPVIVVDVRKRSGLQLAGSEPAQIGCEDTMPRRFERRTLRRPHARIGDPRV